MINHPEYISFCRLPVQESGTTSLIDRLLHHCHCVNIRSNSYRMREHRDLMRHASDQRRQGESNDW